MNGPVQRFYSLDVLRGLAALSVVIWHSRHFFYAGIDPEAITASQQPFHSVLFLFYENGGMAVDLFFSLSGFIFFWLYSAAVAKRSVTARSFIVLRLSRLYPLHLVTLLAVAAGQAYLLYAHGFQFIYQFNDAKHFVLNLLFASSWGLEDDFSFNGPAWSVSVEVLLYAAFFAFCRYLPARIEYVVVPAIFGVLLLPVNYLVGRGFASFFVGGCVLLAYRQIVDRGYAGLFSAPLAIATAAAWLVTLVSARLGWGGEYGVYYWPMLVLFPLTILAFAVIETRRGSLGKRFALLGDISYSVYLLHFPLQLAAVATVVALNADRGVLHSAAFMCGFFAVLLAVSFASYRFLERPALRYFRQRGLGQTAAGRLSGAAARTP